MAMPTKGAFDLRSICNALAPVGTKWKKIGIQLGIPYRKLLEFEKESDPLSAMVDYYLRGNATESVSPISWQSIAEALKSEYVGEPGLAEEISKKYCGTGRAGSSSERPSQDHKLTKEDINFILQRSLNEISRKFASYVSCLCEEIEKKEVAPESLRLFLSNLTAFSNINSNKRQKITLLAKFQQDLEKCSTITDIFNFLTAKCTSFLNYNIYQSIIDRYNISTDQERMKYPDHLNIFIQKHTISEFAKINPEVKTRNGSKELILKLDIETTESLAKVHELTTLIAEIMDLNPSTLQIVDIEDGCVVVTFLIPPSVADVIFTPNTVLTPQQEDKLRAASILWLKCSGYTFHFGKTTDNPALWKLEQQLTCSVCLGNYTDPKVLQCHHTYCQKCLLKLVQQDQQGHRTLPCPSCHRITPIPSGVAGLQAAFQINKLLEIVEEHKKEKKARIPQLESVSTSSAPLESTTISSCPQHDRKEIELYCNTCKETICQNAP